MDAVTTMGGTGTGRWLETRLSDTSGEVGIGVQSLLWSHRGSFYQRHDRERQVHPGRSVSGRRSAGWYGPLQG